MTPLVSPTKNGTLVKSSKANTLLDEIPVPLNTKTTTQDSTLEVYSRATKASTLNFRPGSPQRKEIIQASNIHITSPSPHPRRSFLNLNDSPQNVQHSRMHRNSEESHTFRKSFESYASRHSYGSHRSYTIPTKQISIEEKPTVQNKSFEEESSFLAISKNVRKSVLNAAEKEREKMLQHREVKTPVETKRFSNNIDDDYLDDEENGSPGTAIKFAKLPSRGPYTKKSIGKASSRERSWVDFKPTSAVAATSAANAANISNGPSLTSNVSLPDTATTPAPLPVDVSRSLYPLKTPSDYPDFLKDRGIFESSTPKDLEDEKSLKPTMSNNSRTSGLSRISIQNSEGLHIPKTNSSSTVTTFGSPAKTHIRVASMGSIFGKHIQKQRSVSNDLPTSNPASSFSFIGAFKKAKKMFFRENEHEGLNDNPKASTYGMIHSKNFEHMSRSSSQSSPTKSHFKSHHMDSPIRAVSKKLERRGTLETAQQTESLKSTYTEYIPNSPSKTEHNSPSRDMASAFPSSLKSNETTPSRTTSKNKSAATMPSPTKPKGMYPDVPKLYQEKRTGTLYPSGTSSNAIQAIVDTQKRHTTAYGRFDQESRSRSPDSRPRSPVARNKSPLQTRPQLPSHTFDVSMASIAATAGSPTKSTVARSPGRLGQSVSTQSSPRARSPSPSLTHNRHRNNSVASTLSNSSVKTATLSKQTSNPVFFAPPHKQSISSTSEKSNNLTKKALRRPHTANNSSSQGSNRNSANSLSSLMSISSLASSNSTSTSTIRTSSQIQRDKASEYQAKNHKLLEATLNSKASFVSKPLAKGLRMTNSAEDISEAFSKKFMSAVNKSEGEMPKPFKRNSTLEAENLNKLHVMTNASQQQAMSTTAAVRLSSKDTDTNKKRKSDDSDKEEPTTNKIQRTSSSSNLANMSGVPQRNPVSKSKPSSKPSAPPIHHKTPSSASKPNLMKSAVLHQASKGVPYVEGVKYSNEKIKFGTSTKGYRSLNTFNQTTKETVNAANMPPPSHQNQTPGSLQNRHQQRSVAPTPTYQKQQGIFKTPGRVSALNKTFDLPEIYSESEDDDEGSVIMDWANSPQLHALLLKQQQIDPDTIFGPIAPLQLEDVFRSTQGAKPAKFRPRSSSANWSGQDKLSQAEVEKYAKEMGYK